MLEKLLGILFEMAKGVPRAHFVLTLVKLRGCLSDCQEAYLRFKAVENNAPIDDAPLRKAAREWGMAIRALEIEFRAVDQLLRVFAPEARSHLDKYLQGEVADLNFYEGWLAIQNSTTLGRVERLQKWIGSYEPMIDSIDQFIRDNVKKEEYLTALRMVEKK